MEEERYNSASQRANLETALRLHAQSGEQGGIRIGEWLKNIKRIETLSAETFLPILKEINQPFGYDSTYNIEEDNMVLITHRCPWYQGFRISGQNHENRGELCGHFLRAFFKGLKKIYPNIEYNLEFRQDKEGKCVETVVFT